MSDYEDGSEYRPNLGPPRADDARGAPPPVPPPPPAPGVAGVTGGSLSGNAQDPASVAALALGTLTMVLALFCGLLAIPTGIAAIVLGVRGRARSQAMGKGTGLAVTGMLLGAVGIAVAVVFVILAVGLGATGS